MLVLTIACQQIHLGKQKEHCDCMVSENLHLFSQSLLSPSTALPKGFLKMAYTGDENEMGESKIRTLPNHSYPRSFISSSMVFSSLNSFYEKFDNIKHNS